MYCGSCLRDNTLAATLIRKGHELLLIPTYTPTRTDDINVSSERVFLGGINLYLQHHFNLFRRTPWFFDQILDCRPLLRLTTRFGISVDPARLGRLTVSMLQGAEGSLRKEILKLVRFLADEFSPDIVIIPNSMLISLAPAIKSAMKVPVCCTLQGEELFLESLGEPHKSISLRLIRAHAAHVDAFVAMSAFGAQHISKYLGIERSRIHVVPLGINFDSYGRRKGSDPEPFTVGYLARIAPEKGLHLLCEAYHRLISRGGLPPSRLWAAGYLALEHKPYLADIRRKMNSWGLSQHFEYRGELSMGDKIAFLQDLSVFSVPGSRDDPKGLHLLEAMASGIPVIQPRSGAFTEIVETTRGGVLVKSDDPEDLAEGIFDFWRNPERRREVGSRGYDGVRMHYGADHMADKALQVYQFLL